MPRQRTASKVRHYQGATGSQGSPYKLEIANILMTFAQATSCQPNSDKVLALVNEAWKSCYRERSIIDMEVNRCYRIQHLRTDAHVIEAQARREMRQTP